MKGKCVGLQIRQPFLETERKSMLKEAHIDREMGGCSSRAA